MVRAIGLPCGGGQRILISVAVLSCSARARPLRKLPFLEIDEYEYVIPFDALDTWPFASSLRFNLYKTS